MKTVCRFLDFVGRSLERRILWYLAAFSALYALLTALRAAAKPMWYDELFTYYVSKLPSYSAIWQALKSGVDLNPPFMYAATRASLALLGDGPVATRVPGIIGFWILALCLFFFLRRRLTIPFALAGMLLLLQTRAYEYAYEARAYGIVFGCTGIALVSWQAAAESRYRPLSVIGVWLGLFLALLTHCYAVLLAIPFALGELVRTIQRKRVDWAIWTAFAASTPPLLMYPILYAGRGAFVLSNPVFRAFSVAGFYKWLADAAVWPILWALVIVIAVSRIPREEPKTPSSAWPSYEVAALIGFLVAPFLGMLLAKMYTGVFEFRYGLCAVIGLTSLFAWLACWGTRRSRSAAAIVILFAGLFLSGLRGAGVGSAIRRLVSGRALAAGTADETPSVPGHAMLSAALQSDLPLVISSGLSFLEIDHYGPPALLSRTYYLTDRKAAIEYTGTDVFEVGFPAMRKLFTMRAELADYNQFVAAHDRFLVYAPTSDELGWLLPRLKKDGAAARLLEVDADHVLMDVAPRR